jgi:hypothetical protein
MKQFKTKSATRSAIYKIVSPLTKGFFEDNSWENVNKVWKALESEGVVVNIESAKYDETKSKTWTFTIEVNGFTMTGTLVACFCGTINNPTGRYDICFII